MDDSQINPILLSSSAHLENVEQLIKNLERQTLDIDNFEDILNNRHRQEIITKSFSSLSSSAMALDDAPDDNFLIRSISMTNPANNNGSVSMDSLLTQRDLFENEDENQKKQQQQRSPGNEQSLMLDPETPGFTWDDQYDTRANYKLTFSTEKSQPIDPKMDKSQRHKHHRHHHRHRKHRPDARSNSIDSDDGVPPNLNDWSMRSSINPLEQSIEQRHSKPPTSLSNLPPQTSFVRSQSHPNSFSASASQQPPSSSNAHDSNNNSPNSSTTSSSSASWRRMKDSQRSTSGVETKEPRPPSPMNLYKIFQQKSHTNAASTSPRSAFQYYRQQTDSIVPNLHESMTISGEKMSTDKSRTNQHQRRSAPYEKSATPSTDQAIQTSMFLEPSPTPTAGLQSDSSNRLAVPSPATISSSSIHKSLPDLAFLSQYSKELPRSRTTSPAPSSQTTQIYPSPVIIQQKSDSDKPRTLKSIKRYKNSKHSTEPLNIFYSPQLRKTFAAVPASAVVPGANEPGKVIKMKLPPPSSYPSPVGGGQQQAANLKSCLKYGSRANSCDILAMLQDRQSPAPAPIVRQPLYDTDSLSPSSKRRCSEADVLEKPSHSIFPHTTGSSNDLNKYLISDRRSEHDLAAYQNQTKKSVSFSENIAKHLISPCNPSIQFDPPTEMDLEENDPPADQDLTMMLHGKKENLARKVTQRYGEMRRCQTDIIVVNRVQHLHSFTESPPNEFRFQDTDSLAPGGEDDDDDQSILEKAHVNVIEEPTPALPPDGPIGKISPSNDKENKVPEPAISMTVSTLTINPTNDPSLDGVLEKVNHTVKRIFDVKKSEKAFFLNNESNPQLDSLLKKELCSILQQVLEHGLKPQKNQPAAKQINLWKIIETTVELGQTLQVFTDARQTALNASPYWVYRFQAFIFFLLNKNELITWLYTFMKQKDILQRYYQTPDALILCMTSDTFTLFDRLMAQLEKLSPLAFRLTYKPDPLPSHLDEQLHTSTTSLQSGKSSAREWMATISRRTSKTLTQPIVQPSTVDHTQPNDTIRSTLSRKLNSLFTKGNPAPAATTTTTTAPRKTSSAVTARLPTPRTPTTRLASPTPVAQRRPRTPSSAATTKPVIVSSPKTSQSSRTGTIRRGISPSVVVAPSPPPTLNTAGSSGAAFQSKIPRPSLNVDKPKSARYRSTAPSTK